MPCDTSLEVRDQSLTETNMLSCFFFSWYSQSLAPALPARAPQRPEPPALLPLPPGPRPAHPAAPQAPLAPLAHLNHSVCFLRREKWQ